MTRSLNTLLLLGAIAGTSFGGLIIQPTGGVTTVTPGSTVSLDLIVKNETPAGSHPINIGGDITWEFNTIGFFDVCKEADGSLLGSNGVTFTGSSLESSIVPATGWSEQFVGFGVNAMSFILPNPDTVVLSPGDSFTFATMSLDVPANFTGSFSVVVDTAGIKAFDLGGPDENGLNGANATAIPAVINGSPSWVMDPNAPSSTCGTIPPPPGPPGSGVGNGSSGFTFTAVPEPSGFLFMSCVGLLVGGVRFYRQKLI